jgi:hypothetical protein
LEDEYLYPFEEGGAVRVDVDVDVADVFLAPFDDDVVVLLLLLLDFFFFDPPLAPPAGPKRASRLADAFCL